MNSTDYFTTLAQYNRWMNEKIYAICEELSDEERKRDAGAFFGSIHSTLNHLLVADKAWLNRFENKPIDTPPLGVDLHDDFDELRADRVEMDKRILVWTENLSDDWLEEPFTFTSKVDGKDRVRPAWRFVAHMFNHQTHHRGQTTTLLSQLGIDPGITDLAMM